jgi:hypothetical protein
MSDSRVLIKFILSFKSSTVKYRKEKVEITDRRVEEINALITGIPYPGYVGQSAYSKLEYVINRGENYDKLL